MKGILHLFYGIIRNGKIAFEDKDGFKRTLDKLEGREIALSIKPASVIRSNAENSYYWAVIVRMVSEEMGVLPDEAHDYLKSLFLKVGVEKNGKRWEILRSTTTLDIGEFEDYVSKCRDWASVELNIYVPEPNEVVVDIV